MSALLFFELVPGILLRENLAQIADIGLRLLRRKFLPGDLFRLLEAALQADDKSQVLPDA